jgi:hypothetical protein
MVLENGVKNIQAAAYNGARTVYDNPENVWVSELVQLSDQNSRTEKGFSPTLPHYIFMIEKREVPQHL